MTATQPPARGTVLAFDFGLRRIGVAVGELHPATAAPLSTLQACADGPDWPAIAALVSEWRPVRLLVGIPRHADGSEGDMAAACRQFSSELEQRSGIVTELVDESLSSRSANAELREHRRSGRMRRRVRKGDSDRIAARLILEHWLAQRTGYE